ncbi:hypothetical protein ACK32Z_18155 [Aeromonas hydrophila]|uniref:hypothetical protein n=1 Tax=Aeromonas TaxID=642 RepID=UPI0039872FC4
MENIKGSLGFLGLTDWWLNEISKKERETILAIYNPMCSSSSNLIEGDISWTTEEPISLIYGIASWLKEKEHLELSMKLFSKAKSLIKTDTSALNIHFLYYNEIKIYYRHRDFIGLEPTITACEQQIKIAEKAAQEFVVENLQQLDFAMKRKLAVSQEFYESLPSHTGYKQLSIIMANLNQYQKAIDLCEQAQAQGWSGDWDKRIERYKKKAGKVTG